MNRPWVIQKKIDDVWHVVSSYHPTKDDAYNAMLAMINSDLVKETEAEAYRVYYAPRLVKNET